MSTTPPNPPAPVDAARLAIAVDVWKNVVSVQMHFNDMEMKVRNLYFTILAAAVGAVGVVQGKWVPIPYLELNLSLAMLVLCAVIPVSWLFYFIDRHWYHRFLLAAVLQGGAIEDMYKDALPKLQLGRKISTSSPVKFKHPIWKWLFFFIRDKRFRQDSNIHSDQKIELLYKSVYWGVGCFVIIYALIRGVDFRGHPLLFWIIEFIKSGI